MEPLLLADYLTSDCDIANLYCDEFGDGLKNINKLIGIIEAFIEMKNTYHSAPFWLCARENFSFHSLHNDKAMYWALEKCYRNVTLAEFVSSSINESVITSFEDELYFEFNFVERDSASTVLRRLLYLYQMFS